MRNKSQRVGIFIDVQNLYHSAKHLYGGKVNYRELIKALTDGRQLIRALGYVVKSETSDKSAPTGEASFFEALEKAGVELRMKDIQVFPGGVKKANWDVGMAVDALRMSSFLDVIILVTGDGDFEPLVEYIQWGMGRIVEVAAFGYNTSSKLKEATDLFVDLEKMPRVMLKK